jgi:F-type H+-transporting ATPase subunit b
MALYTLAADQTEVTAVGLIPFITTIVVFLIVLAIAAKFIWPLILKGLDERDQKIRQEIASAEEARENAKKLLQDYERNLTAAREEAGQMIAKARADARAVAEELRSRNDAELADLKARAMSEIESAKKTAIAELHAEAATIATAMAGKILQREISAIDQQRLVDDSLGELAGAGRG